MLSAAASRVTRARTRTSPPIEEYSMTVRPSLVRSIPFWILLVGSLATSAFGAWLAVTSSA